MRERALDPGVLVLHREAEDRAHPRVLARPGERAVVAGSILCGSFLPSAAPRGVRPRERGECADLALGPAGRAHVARDWTIAASGIAPAGFVLDLTVRGSEPFRFRAADCTPGLPPPLAAELGPLPPELVPWDHGLCTVVARDFSF